MNPETTIRPWLLACSLQGNIGAVEAFEIAAPDMTGKEEEIYFVYTVKGGREIPSVAPIRKNSPVTAEGYDVDVSASKPFKLIVEVDIFNSQDGMEELAGCFTAAQTDQDLINLLRDNIAPVLGSSEVFNLTTRDGNRLHYHHKMICHFTTTWSFKHRKINHRVGTIALGAATL